MGKATQKFAVLTALVLVASAELACRKVTFVSFSEAEKTGDEYYRHLESDETAEAMKFYSSEFVDADYRAFWGSFLADRAKQWGSCQEHSLIKEQFIPRVKDDPSVPADECYLMKYDVAYGIMKVQETLLLCPDPRDKILRIIGTKLERDGAQPITAGKMVNFTGITVGR